MPRRPLALALALALALSAGQAAVITVMQATLDSLLAEMRTSEIQTFESAGDYLGPLLTIDREARMLDFQCSPLFEELQLQPSHWPPPLYPDFDQKNAFAMGGLATFRTRYYTDLDAEKPLPAWTEGFVKLHARLLQTCGGTNLSNCTTPVERYRDFVQGKRGVVFNIDRSPWAEAGLLQAGAAHIISVINASVNVQHNQLTAMRPSALGEHFLSDAFEPADFAFSFNAVEHDGLGRYGDPLRPGGDLESIARAHCLLRDGGVLFLALPLGPDAVVWNAHRIYGRHRLALALANWEVVDSLGMLWGLGDATARFSNENRPVWVLRKRPAARGAASEVRVEALMR